MTVALRLTTMQDSEDEECMLHSLSIKRRDGKNASRVESSIEMTQKSQSPTSVIILNFNVLLM